MGVGESVGVGVGVTHLFKRPLHCALEQSNQLQAVAPHTAKRFWRRLLEKLATKPRRRPLESRPQLIVATFLSSVFFPCVAGASVHHMQAHPERLLDTTTWGGGVLLQCHRGAE